jgi:Restriction endonuclease
MARPMSFGDMFTPPSRSWAEQWPSGFREAVPVYLDAYRAYVRDYYAAEYASNPRAFLRARPIEVAAVASLPRIWVFMRAAVADTVTVIEAWDDQRVADYDFLEARPNERIVRDVADFFLDDPAAWELLQEVSFSPVTPLVPNFIWLWPDRARAEAEIDAQGQRLQQSFYEGPIDVRALSLVQRDFARLEASDDPRGRGIAFDGLVRDLLSAHGCEVVKGKKRPGEQVDVLMVEPDMAVIECRWTSPPTDSAAVHVLMGKVEKRPPVVSGLYFSMSGFTSDTASVVRDLSPKRTLILIGPDDIRELVAGTVRFAGYLRKRKLDVVRGYSS